MGKNVGLFFCNFLNFQYSLVLSDIFINYRKLLILQTDSVPASATFYLFNEVTSNRYDNVFQADKPINQ